jgi:hypothetical protein
MIPNAALLLETMAKVEEVAFDPKAEIGWNQLDWRHAGGWRVAPSGRSVCSTTMCFGGWACVLSGATFVVHDVVRVNGEHFFAGDYAAQELRLTPDEAGELFGCGNTLNELRWIVHQLVRKSEKMTAKVAKETTEKELINA